MWTTLLISNFQEFEFSVLKIILVSPDTELASFGGTMVAIRVSCESFSTTLWGTFCFTADSFSVE